MHAPLGDHFAVEVRELFQKPHVLPQGGAARAGGLCVLIVDDRCAEGGSQFFHGESWIKKSGAG
jgi:hypothetical protein